MQEWMHGGDLHGRGPVIDFSANINPLGLPDEVLRALIGSAADWARYPDPFCRDLTVQLAVHEGIPKGWIHFGNGAADLIYRAARALSPKRALIPAPTFSEYERSLSLSGCEIEFYPLSRVQDFLLDEGILERIGPGLELCILCNPNNPTGQLMDGELLEKILEKCSANGTALLIDECFIPFVDEPNEHTLKRRLSDHPNLMILRAFTKFYAMAGLRLGYLLCADEKKVLALRAQAPPWNISAPAQTAGLAALDAQAYAARTRKLIRTERAFLADGLRAFGLHPLGAANYLFFEALPGLKERLLKHSLLIRQCGDYRELDGGCYRVAVRTHKENRLLLDALRLELEG